MLQKPALTLIILLVAMVAGLAVSGQPFICPCGTLRLWYGPLSGPETSQQLLDFYTFTHINHGFLFYSLLGLGWRFYMPQNPIPFLWLLVAAIALEAGWEVLENSSFIIDRYRQSGIAAGYFGDSIVNSLSDVAAMVFGFFIAHRVGWKGALLFFVASELTLAMTLRDSVLLSAWGIIGLPESVQAWQAGSIAQRV